MSLFRETFFYIRSFSSDFWIVIIATLMNQLGNMAFVFLLLYLSKYLGYSLIKASLVFAALSAATLLAGLCSGILINRLSALLSIIVSLLVNGLTLLVIPFFQHFIAIFILCFIWGCAYGLYRPASQTLVSYLSKPGLHKITFSIYRLSLNLGMSIGPAMGAYLATHSFKLIFIANGITNLLACLILITGIGRSKWITFRPKIQNKLKHSIIILKQDVTFSLFLLGIIPISMVFFQHESTLPIFLSEYLFFPLSFYGWLFTLNTLLIVFF